MRTGSGRFSEAARQISFCEVRMTADAGRDEATRLFCVKSGAARCGRGGTGVNTKLRAGTPG
jgi:hypothetical protein